MTQGVKDLYRAGDFQNLKPRWLHMSGQHLTSDITYSWIGTLDQFEALCEKYEWDGLGLVLASKT